MSLKETIFSMMLEALELGEAVEVRHDRYMRSHGKKARDSGGGSSSWMFTHKPMGDVDVKNKEEVHTAQGKFSDAKKSAQQWGKQHGHSSVYVMEEVELDEEGHGVFLKGGSVGEKRSGKPVEVHKNIDDAKAQAKRLNKLLSPGEKQHYGLKYHVKPVTEGFVVELEEAETPTYHYYTTKNGIGAKEMKLTHAKSKPFTSETDALKHILKTGGRQDGIIHTVNSASGKIVQHRGVDGGQKGYPTPASDMAGDAPKHVRDLKEEVNQIDEISDEKKKDYIRAVADKGGMLRKPRPASLKGIEGTKVDSLAKAFKGGDMQDYANLHKKSEKRAGIALKALNSLKKEEVELDELAIIKNNRKFSNVKRFDTDKETNAFLEKNPDHGVLHTDDGGTYVAKNKNKGATIKALNGLKKEEVELDEVSKATLGSYIKKASHDVATKSAATGRYGERTNKEADVRNKTGDMSNHSQGREDAKMADKFFTKSWKRREGIAKAADRLTKEEVELDEAKTDIYHKHMLKALGKTRLPKDHNYTSAIANNGDFVVHNAGRVVGRIAKGEHDLK